MSFIDEIKRAFKVPANHDPRVILVGATDKSSFELVWGKHDLDEVTADMDENASKQGMSYSPVFVIVLEGKGGHIDAEIVLPLQSWGADLRLPKALRDSKDLQRITDWLAGFMEPFSMNDTVSGVDVQTGMLLFGDASMTAFNMDNVMKSIRPKRDKSELMNDAINIGTVEEILAGQMTVKEVEKITRKPERGAVSIEEEPDVKEPDLLKMAEDAARKTQQDILDKYGFKALEELLEKTGKPLLVTKPKSKKV
jgi:hypothetical protein